MKLSKNLSMQKSDPLISILIATLESRKDVFSVLYSYLQKMNIYADKVEIIINSDSGQRTLGEKRNDFIRQAKGKYIAMIDDDDWVAEEYLHYMIKAAESECDCASLVGKHYMKGKFIKPFYHSIKYRSWWEDENGYYRYPNHLNLIKKELVNDIFFLEKDYKYGKDYEWSKQINESGRLKNEFVITQTLYRYDE